MIFLDHDEVKFMQRANIDRFGGSHGIRDEGALESALDAAENRAYYGSADEVACATTYGFHLCQAHAFIDGNKRIAAAALLVFLDLNSVQHAIGRDELGDWILAIASGEMTRDQFESHVRGKVLPKAS